MGPTKSMLDLACGYSRMQVDQPVRLGRWPVRDPQWPDGVGHLVVLASGDPSVSRTAAALDPEDSGWFVANPTTRSPITLVAPAIGELEVPPGTRVSLPGGRSMLLVPGVFGPHNVVLHLAASQTLATARPAPGDTTVGLEEPDPILRHWLAARYGSYVRPTGQRPRVRSATDAYRTFTAALGSTSSQKGLMRREEKLRRALGEISDGVDGRAHAHRFVNELVHRGLLTAADVTALERLLADDRPPVRERGGQPPRLDGPPQAPSSPTPNEHHPGTDPDSTSA